MKTSEKIDYNFLIKNHDIASRLIESTENENLMDDLSSDEDEDNIDIENDINIEDINNDEDITPAIETPMDQVNEPISKNSAMQVVSLEDVLAIINQITTSNEIDTPPASVDSPDPLVVSKDEPLKSGEDALLNAFFQSEGNETLDSDFAALQTNILNLETHLDPNSSYINVLGSKPVGSESEDTDSDLQCDMDYNDPRRLIDGLPNSKDFDPNNPEGEEMLLDFDLEDDSEMNLQEIDDEGEIEYPEDSHPDLYRFGATDYMGDDEEDEEYAYNQFDLEPEEEEEEMGKPLTMNKSMNVAGQQVQIILTGVVISAPELNYIGEAVKNAGIKLLSITGKKDNLSVIVETEGKEYKIDYVDIPKIKSKTPFSINKTQFSSFEEALDRINYKAAIRESEIFNTIIDKKLSDRKLNEYTDSDIFSNKNYAGKMPAFWTVHPVGFVNLKNGMNETYSNITHSNAKHVTLMLNEAGEYYMLLGDLKERSQIGTVRLLTEKSGNKNYGNAEVINIYKNDINGLGQMMYDIKRTSVPLLVWK